MGTKQIYEMSIPDTLSSRQELQHELDWFVFVTDKYSKKPTNNDK